MKKTTQIFIAILAIILSSCNNENQNIAFDKDIDELPSQVDTIQIENLRAYDETIYIFNNNDLSDSIVKQICEINDPYVTYECIDNIYSSSKHFANNFYFEKMFFRKCVDLNTTEVCFLYADPYNEERYNAEFFELSGGVEIVSVFRYEYDWDLMYNKNLLVIISETQDGNYASDIFMEDCGMKYCGMLYFYQNNSFKREFFKNIKNKDEFFNAFSDFNNSSQSTLNF